ncbi:MAG: 50S ribosomal protein L5 [Actinobacteria bacterium]|nr:50S ribosomal protein L5 [Actinomycetota bacterium]
MLEVILVEPRLKEKYKKEIIPKILKNRKFNNVMEVPRINKITVNMGIGSAIQNIKELESASQDLAKITGQKPVITKARKSVAGFKLRQGNPIGCMVTLRGKRMYEFLDRLLSIAIPRIRDFRGLSKKSFDGSGNYTIGIKEQLIFPEVEYDSILSVKGMNITITTSAENDDEALFLLEEFGFPFKK